MENSKQREPVVEVLNNNEQHINVQNIVRFSFLLSLNGYLGGSLRVTWDNRVILSKILNDKHYSS